MTDLIARLEELEKEATPGPWNSRWYVEGATQEEWGPASPLVARIEYANSNCVGKRHIPWSQTDADLLSELRNNLPAILHALKVQEAAEDLTGLLTERPKLLCPVCGMRPDMHDDWCAWGKLERAVKGEQP